MKPTLVSWSENCPICGQHSSGCLMQMLMSGDTLTTEELMYLQDFHNLQDNTDKKVPLSVIAHYDCFNRYTNGEVPLLDHVTDFRNALNWNVFPKELLYRFVNRELITALDTQKMVSRL